MRTIGLVLVAVAVASACAPVASPPEGSVAPFGSSSPSSAPSSSPLTFVVPEPEPEATTPDVLPSASFTYPEIASEVTRVFERVYEARTLRPGGSFDVAGLRRLVAGVYADYTLPLFNAEVRDAKAGILQQVSFSDINVELAEWLPRPDNYSGIAYLKVTRTRHETRKGETPTNETASFYFRALRQRLGSDGVSWVIDDFATSQPWGPTPRQGYWISELQPVSDAEAASELKAFFERFYDARSLSAGKPIDLGVSSSLVAGSYAAYTLPLLQRSIADAESGALKEIRYADIAVKLESWNPTATNHGGLATVAVTRTAFVTKSTGADPPERATYEFRVHRHLAGQWLAVDFFRPDLNRWVTSLAGATVIVPFEGHG